MKTKQQKNSKIYFKKRSYSTIIHKIAGHRRCKKSVTNYTKENKIMHTKKKFCKKQRKIMKRKWLKLKKRRKKNLEDGCWDRWAFILRFSLAFSSHTHTKAYIHNSHSTVPCHPTSLAPNHWRWHENFIIFRLIYRNHSLSPPQRPIIDIKHFDGSNEKWCISVVLCSY